MFVSICDQSSMKFCFTC